MRLKFVDGMTVVSSIIHPNISHALLSSLLTEEETEVCRLVD
jgi:hypothetical protein